MGQVRAAWRTLDPPLIPQTTTRDVKEDPIFFLSSKFTMDNVWDG